MNDKRMKCHECASEGRGLEQKYNRVTQQCQCGVHQSYRASECIQCGSQDPWVCPECERECKGFDARIRAAEQDPSKAAGKYVGWSTRNAQLDALNSPTKSYIYASSPEAEILFSIGWDGRIIATWENTVSGKAYAEDDMWFRAGYDTHSA